jgi:Xaa-Pro aminopeptidase
MGESVKSRISKLRELMNQNGMDAYVVPSADNHQSEYVGEFFKARAFVTGFTGSAGTAVITKDEAGLWTDGRYFLQAEKQLEGSGIKLFKMGNPGVPTVNEFIEEKMPQNGTLGFDGRLMAMGEGNEFVKQLEYKNVGIEYSHDLVDKVWENRPEIAKEPVFLLDEKYSGESRASKLKRVREVMRENKASHHVITSLDDIAWLLNVRGSDVLYSPLVLCYAVVGLESVELFIDQSRLNNEVKSSLDKDRVTLRPYNDIYEYVKSFNSEDVVMIDPDRVNYALYKNIPTSTKKVERENPTTLFKAIKNDIELANIEKAHIKDGVAITKFMYWLKQNVGKNTVTEISASDKLRSFREEQEGYLWESFAPICAFKDHAAMMHYSATPKSDVELTKGHLFLTDTGGNYYEGTTDITRTFALGEISREVKKHYTIVAKSMMSLARAKFLYGCRGYNLDVLAREPIWNLNIDYKCGTGHGVGYLLNIHEGPSGFRWQVVPSKHETHILEAGMVITDEPGIYIDGSHGIRIENELILRKGVENEFGQFMHFEPVTYAPIDLDAIDPSELNEDDRAYLNSYHETVYNKLSEHLTQEEREWLKEYTRSI